MCGGNKCCVAIDFLSIVIRWSLISDFFICIIMVVSFGGCDNEFN